MSVFHPSPDVQKVIGAELELMVDVAVGLCNETPRLQVAWATVLDALLAL